MCFVSHIQRGTKMISTICKTQQLSKLVKSIRLIACDIYSPRLSHAKLDTAKMTFT